MKEMITPDGVMRDLVGKLLWAKRGKYDFSGSAKTK